MQPNTQSGASRWPHRWAVLVVCATFPLIWVGGLVTTYKAGMAVPDYPTTYGYNMFLYPWQTWINGPWDIFIEHGHRQWGAIVGMVTIGLVVSVLFQDSRRWMKCCAVVALAAVICQGLLGGGRVRLDEILLARIHGCVGPAFFAYATALAVCTSRFWRERTAGRMLADGIAPAEHDSSSSRPEGNLPADLPTAGGPVVSSSLVRLAVVTVLMAYTQLVLGSLLRHVPPGTGPAAFQAAVWAHLLVAALLAGHIVWLATKVFRSQRGQRAVVRPAVFLAALVVVQGTLGAGTWVLKYGWPAWLTGSSTMIGASAMASFTVSAGSRLQAWITTLHVAVGSLILAVAVMVALRLSRLARWQGLNGLPRLHSAGRVLETVS